jgi:glycosyltransferase XagB
VGCLVSKRVRAALRRNVAREDKNRDPSAFAIGRAAGLARTSLASTNPKQSAARPAGRVMVVAMLLLTFAASLGALGIDQFEIFWTVAAGLFTLVGLLRAAACFVPQVKNKVPQAVDTLDVVPVWTILIALYDEADSVASLLAALAKLDWNKRQLDIIFACERDDTKTLQALMAQQGTHDFRIVRVPKGGPRTKPNALQTALPFARGRYLTVYDAEDRPDPSQLRAAFEAFNNGPDKLAVLQAPLVAWNHNESWIARQFALDYAVWFRVMLPALAHVSGILPLGGTSNHFRTSMLREVGGWDPFNVTEDADLGFRFGRQGYQAALISPPTLEEAPPRINAWVKQRGRWIQGHIQTFSVHLREPFSLSCALGWRGMMAFIVGLGVGPMSAVFVLPILACSLLSLTAPIDAKFWLPVLLGLVGHGIASIVGAYRDGRWSLLFSCFTLPLYHCLQSLSACRALWRVVFTPSFWDKTDHGSIARERTAQLK